MTRYGHRIKVLLVTLLLAGSINIAGILQYTQTGGVIAALLFLTAFFLFLFVNIVSGTDRLAQLDKGSELILYTGLTSVISTVWLFWLGFHLPETGIRNIMLYILAILLCLCGEGILLLNGSLRLMVTSVQMGLRYRILLVLCWWIPVLNLFLFFRLYRLGRLEYEMELEKEELNAVRKESECCHTKYPLLMVHGVFFRDTRFFNYWGRIPKELIRNGATVYYGNQQSAASVEVCGQELADRIAQIVSETGCGKLNVIAHSKGGLDMRYALSKCGAGEYVASLTTINTPHKGCLFADYLLEKAPAAFREFLAGRYNDALRRFGDASPDFIAAVSDLTAGRCTERNKQLTDCREVYYQSVATSMKKARSGRFPLNVSYHLVKYFDGENDGLVAIESALWGNVYRILRMKGMRGISHGDMIDLYRENIREFDVREFYVNLVGDLKEKGF